MKAKGADGGERESLNHLELYLFGTPRAVRSRSVLEISAKKLWAVMAYVTLEGPTTRSKLAGMLWSEVDEESARRNLRVILHRGKISNPEVFNFLNTGDEMLELVGKCTCDAVEYEQAIQSRDYKLVDRLYAGDFLDGLELEGADEFSQWQQTLREKFQRAWQKALLENAEILESKGDWHSALDIHLRLLEADNLQERQHREVMRLFYLMGDSGAALEQFEQLKQTLKKELGEEPKAETLNLLQTIQSGGSAGAKNAKLLTSQKKSPDAPLNWVGRSSEISEVLIKLEKGGKVLMQGFGGMGKTALAGVIANKLLEDSVHHIVWMRAGQQGADSVFESISGAYGKEQEFVRAEHKGAFIFNLLRAEKPILLVLDDAGNNYALQKTLESVPKGISLLVTSRVRHPGFYRVAVGKLSRPESLELIRVQAGLEESKKDKALESLCELLGDHPYAIRLAGLTLKTSGEKPKELFSRIKNSPHTLKTPAEFSEAGYDSVAGLLDQSLSALEDLEYEAFLAFGSLEVPSCSANFMGKILRRDESSAEAALDALSRKGLVDREGINSKEIIGYRQHDLSHSYAKSNRFIRVSSLIRLSGEYVDVNRSQIDLLEVDIGNLLFCAKTALEASDFENLVSLMGLLCTGGGFFTARGHFGLSSSLLGAAAKACEKMEASPVAGPLMGAYADYLAGTGADNQSAVDWYRKAAQAHQKVGNLHGQIACLGEIGRLFSLGKMGDAEIYFSEADALSIELGEPIVRANLLEKRAYCLGIAGDLEGAEALLLESVRLLDSESSRGSDLGNRFFHYQYFAKLNLAECQKQLKKYDGALGLALEAEQLAEMRENEIWQAHSLFLQGEVYLGTQNNAEAEQKLQSAQKLYEKNNLLAEADECRKTLGLMGSGRN